MATPTPTILAVFGTRPEVIKLAPVLEALRGHASRARTVLCATGQHRQLVEQAMNIFGLQPDINLDVMEANQSLTGLTARLFERLGAGALVREGGFEPPSP